MWDELYEDYYRELVTYGTRMSGSKELAEDLVQETFVKALMHAGTMEDLSPKKRRAWLYRTTCYPDGATVLKRNAVIDKLFSLRAKNSLYWSARRMIMVDPELDAEVLRSKGASFSTKEVIVAKSKIEALIDLIDENAEITVVPDGTAVVSDDITLDDATLRRYGNQLYVIGDVTVPEDATALDELKYLNVRGNATVPEEHKEKLLGALTEISGEVKISKPKGATLEDKPFVKITRWMLEQQPMGLDVSDCAVVKIADDIPKELIAERLHISDCGVVKCSEELEDAVTMVCEDVGQVGSSGGEGDIGIGDIIKGALETPRSLTQRNMCCDPVHQEPHNV